MQDIRHLLTLACAGLVACGSDPEPEPAGLPALFALEGHASAEANGQTLECRIDYVVELQREVLRTANVVEYSGTMGGGAGRSLRNPDGSGVDLFGDAFSRVTVRLQLPATVTIRSNGQPAPAVPPDFWDGVAGFDGRLGPGDLISGDWRCQPFYTEIGGIDDSVLTADGSWFTTTLAN